MMDFKSHMAMRSSLRSLNNDPLYDSVDFNPGGELPEWVNLFRDPLGSTIGPDGTIKERVYTNMILAGALPTPEQFDLFGVRIVFVRMYPFSAWDRDYALFNNLAMVDFLLNNKVFFSLPFSCIPQTIQKGSMVRGRIDEGKGATPIVSSVRRGQHLEGEENATIPVADRSQRPDHPISLVPSDSFFWRLRICSDEEKVYTDHDGKIRTMSNLRIRILMEGDHYVVL